MAKRKKSSRTYKPRTKGDDRTLMLLAGAAAILVGFFAIFAYKNGSVVAIPTPTPKIVSVRLDPQNLSGESGMATLTEVNGKVMVNVSLTGAPSNVTQPAHIHLGSCPNPGAIEYPLTSLVNGQSQTTLNVTLGQLKSMEPLAINVHKSVSEVGTYVSCGDLKL